MGFYFIFVCVPTDVTTGVTGAVVTVTNPGGGGGAAIPGNCKT